MAIKNTDWMMGKRTGVAYPGEIEMVLLPAIATTGREVMDLLRETRVAIANELGSRGEREKGRKGELSG